jgi:hypothetical protein
MSTIYGYQPQVAAGIKFSFRKEETYFCHQKKDHLPDIVMYFSPEYLFMCSLALTSSVIFLFSNIPLLLLNLYHILPARFPNTIFYHPAALYCSMDLAGYVSACVQLYCVSFHCLSLHVLAYMAIFK